MAGVYFLCELGTEYFQIFTSIPGCTWLVPFLVFPGHSVNCHTNSLLPFSVLTFLSVSTSIRFPTVSLSVHLSLYYVYLCLDHLISVCMILSAFSPVSFNPSQSYIFLVSSGVSREWWVEKYQETDDLKGRK